MEEQFTPPLAVCPLRRVILCPTQVRVREGTAAAAIMVLYGFTESGALGKVGGAVNVGGVSTASFSDCTFTTNTGSSTWYTLVIGILCCNEAFLTSLFEQTGEQLLSVLTA